jgi:hypothetical protein
MIVHHHYQGHLGANVGACLCRSCIGCSADQWVAGFLLTQVVRNWHGRWAGFISVYLPSKLNKLLLMYAVNWVRDRKKCL